MTFRKEGAAAAIRTEVASLRWLAEAAAQGGAPVVGLEATGEGFLETTLLQQTIPTPAAAEEFGRRLAHTHAAGADFWGQLPPGLDPADAVLADLPSPGAGQATWHSWGAFFAEARLAPYLRLAVDNGEFNADQERVVDRALQRIAAGQFDAPQPALVGDGVARLHGDLWSGNVVWAAGEGTCRGTLIDPSSYGGHAETDLAELAVFDAPHLARILAGYDEVSRLADGWDERIVCHQLHMVLVHVALFGESYVGRALHLARAVVG